MTDSRATMRDIRLALVCCFLLGCVVVGPLGVVSANDDDVLLDHANGSWRGDFDGMRERGFVRVLTVYDPFGFTYDGIDHARGLAVELSREFEEWLNEHYADQGRPIQIVLMPVVRDKLLPNLIAGRGDIAIGNISITMEKAKIVDFSKPVFPAVRELVVTGPNAPVDIASLDDLVEMGVNARASSSSFEHLLALNDIREAEGKPPIPLHKVDERLEDYDLINMVDAGVYPAAIADSHLTNLWSQLFANIVVHEDISIHDDGQIAWAIRKKSPELMDVVNQFVKQIRAGSLLGNVLRERYLGSTDWIDEESGEESRARYEATISVIKEFAEKYDFDWLMIAAQAYQESKLDNGRRSPKGAVGIMQILPSTASDPNVAISGIESLENNVHAGVKYLRFIEDRYFSEAGIDPVDRALFAFAAYNAGPRNIALARGKAAELGFDPNLWFGNVEVVAARTISQEPVIYVRNIYKYYVAYEHLAAIKEARQDVISGSGRRPTPLNGYDEVPNRPTTRPSEAVRRGHPRG